MDISPYPKDNKDGFALLSAGGVAPRFEHISSAIRSGSSRITDMGLTERPTGTAKTDLVAILRAGLADSALPWLDAALALSGEGLAYPQLLGTGGNDGRLDFTNNFARRLVSRETPTGLFDPTTGHPSNDAEALIENTLLAAPTSELSSAAIGQFAPGAVGKRPNGTTGFSSDSAVNPWDFVLMLEGATAFAGTASRRHQTAAGFGASFPFTVRTVGGGWGGLQASDENDARAEFWAPLWTRPARFCEIDSLLGEGRAVLNGRTAKDGLDFARATATLGVSRGFSEFERFGFLMRAGKAYLATPIGRRSTAPSRAARLISDLDAGDWLDRVWRLARNEEGPGAARLAIKCLEDAIFRLVAADVTSREVERVIVEIGRVAGWLANSPTGRETLRSPPPLLSATWLERADDESAEFRVAASLAGLGLPAGERLTGPDLDQAANGSDTDASTVTQEASDTEEPLPDDRNQARSTGAPPMAAHFAPIDESSFFYKERLGTRRSWSVGGAPPTMVWGAGPLITNMIAVLERRLVEAAIRGLEDKPLASAAAARQSDVAAFLSGDFDDARCAALLAGLVWARPTYLRSKRTPASVSPLPFAYAALKPLFTPDAVLQSAGILSGTARMPVPPGLVARLRAGGDSRDGRATDPIVRLVLARARASGLPTPFDTPRSGTRESVGRMGAGVAADRLAASLLIPIGDSALTTLVERAYPGTLPEDDNVTTEDTKNAD